MTPGFGEIAERLRRSTVQIVTGGRDRGGGSGVIWSGEGVIVTNAHVARAPRATVELWDGRRFEAGVASRDPQRDLATLRVAASGLPEAAFGDSDSLRPGELVIAVGNPLGFAGALSTGVIHSVGPIPGMGPQSWVRAAVRLAPGNSGGPLANAEGKVIGINTAVVNGLGVAAPANAVGTHVRRGKRPRLGVSLRPVSPGRGIPLGLLVLEVEPESAAAQASLWVGDILTGANGRPFQSVDDLAGALDSSSGVVDLEFLRGDRSRTRRAAVRLGVRASEAA
jgi:serine protease Do